MSWNNKMRLLHHLPGAGTSWPTNRYGIIIVRFFPKSWPYDKRVLGGHELSKKVWPWKVTVSWSNKHRANFSGEIRQLYFKICFTDPTVKVTWSCWKWKYISACYFSAGNIFSCPCIKILSFPSEGWHWHVYTRTAGRFPCFNSYMLSLHWKNHILIQVLLSIWWNVQTKYLLAWTRKFYSNANFCVTVSSCQLFEASKYIYLVEGDVFLSVGILHTQS